MENGVIVDTAVEKTKSGEVGESLRATDFLKVLAMVLMAIDHIGAVFFPEKRWIRILGRLSFPLFAYGLALGFARTKSLKWYGIRLWILALISQVPYTLLFSTTHLNIFFTLLMGLFLLHKVEKKEYSWIPSMLIMSEILHLDYGAYGVCLILLLGMVRKGRSMKSRSWGLVLLALLHILYSLIYPESFQYYALLALPLFYFEDRLPFVKLNKLPAYLFYPFHLAVLLLAVLIFN